VRTCLALALRARAAGQAGIVTAGSRSSPQVNIVARVARHLGLAARCHTPTGQLAPEVLSAESAGAEIVQHPAGRNSVIIARAREDAKERGWAEIPFGMECAEAIEQTRRQVRDIPAGVERLVIPVGSGMSLAGLLWGLSDIGRADLPVLGVIVGADPLKRLDRYAPGDWEARVQLVPSGTDYHAEAETTDLDGLGLDPHYEAKCIPFVKAADLLWVVGIRATAIEPLPAVAPEPQWHVGDSSDLLSAANEASPIGDGFDMIFSCPPYGDLEVYSDDPADISTMEAAEFDIAYERIIRRAIERLADNRFAVFVVGDYRDKRGFYRNLIAKTTAACEAAGARLYNEAILITSVGSLPIRAAKQFRTTRKLGKTHQQIMIYLKGDPRKATAALGPVDVSAALADIEADDGA
jgi:hypothetical protein